MTLDNNKNSVVDLSYLEEYTDGDQEMIDELIAAFLETTSEGLVELKSGIDMEDSTVWTQAAHKLKGAAGYVGADTMKTLCAEAQAMTTSTQEERSSFYHKVVVSCDTVCDFLNGRG